MAGEKKNAKRCATTVIPEFATFSQMRAERAQEEIKAAKKGATYSEQSVASLTSHSGWSEVEKYIFERISALQSGLQTAIASGSSFEAIGQRAVVARMAQEELEGILNFVRTREKYISELNEKEK